MDYKKWLPLFLILFFGLAIRLTALNSESMWIDEVTTVFHAKSSFLENLKWTTTDTNVPLYSIVLWFWIRIFGISALSVRLLSVIFGVMAILFLYLLGKKIFNEKVGLYAAALLSISPFHIMYSQDARSYALFCFLSILSTYFYFSLFKRKNAYLISTTLLLYTHLFGFFVLLIQNIAFIYKKKQIIRWLKLQSIVVIAFIPWVSTLMYQIKYVQSKFWIAPPTFKDFIFAFFEIASNRIYLILSSILIIYLVIKYYNKKILHLFVLFLLPPLFTLAYSIIKTPLFLTRYFIFILPPYLLLLALAISKFKRTAQIIMIVGFLFLSSTTVFHIYINKEKPDWESLTAYLQENIKDDEMVIVQPSYQLEPFIYYFDKGCFNENLYNCNNRYIGIEEINELENIKKSFWYIQSEIQGRFPDDPSNIEENFTKHDFYKLKLFHMS